MVSTKAYGAQATEPKHTVSSSNKYKYPTLAVVAILSVQVFFMIRSHSDYLNPLTKTQLQSEDLMMQGPRSSASSSSSSSALKERAATPTVHVLQGLRGNKTGFIDQWEVNLKSVLLNAPLDANLHIHILSNAAAKEAVLERIQAGGLEGSPWRNQVSITVYNVEKYEAEWTELIRKKIRVGNKIDGRTTLGGYYRLLAYQVLPKHNNETIGPILYMDADVVVLANLNDLWRKVDTTKGYLYQWSTNAARQKQGPNSGFVVFHLDKFEQWWDLLDRLPKITSGGDQALMILIHEAFPNVTGPLPAEWDTHLGHGWRPNPHTLLQKQDKVGFVHFTGTPPTGSSYLDSPEGVQKYCNRVKSCRDSPKNQDLYRKSWGLVEYYIRVQWKWVKYFGESSVHFGEQGRELKLRVID